jgi:hypothetical protein
MLTGLVEKPEWMKPFGRPGRRLENNIKIYIKKMIVGRGLNSTGS